LPDPIWVVERIELAEVTMIDLGHKLPGFICGENKNPTSDCDDRNDYEKPTYGESWSHAVPFEKDRLDYSAQFGIIPPADASRLVSACLFRNDYQFTHP
jgi:hypothetical protein